MVNAQLIAIHATNVADKTTSPKPAEKVEVKALVTAVVMAHVTAVVLTKAGNR